MSARAAQIRQDSSIRLSSRKQATESWACAVRQIGSMEPLIYSVTTTVAQDVRGLVYATQFAPPAALLEKDPPNWRWHLPLGFVTLVAAGMLLIAAGGVQWHVQEQKQGGARYHRTQMHKKKIRPQLALPPP